MHAALSDGIARVPSWLLKVEIHPSTKQIQKLNQKTLGITAANQLIGERGSTRE